MFTLTINHLSTTSSFLASKSLSFGFAISLISCSCGMGAKDGAKGVGIATTKAVVWSFVAIVILDLIFAAVYFY